MWNDEANKKKYAFVSSYNEKARKEFDRIFKNKMTNDEGRGTRKQKPDKRVKKIIWKEK